MKFRRKIVSFARQTTARPLALDPRANGSNNHSWPRSRRRGTEGGTGVARVDGRFLVVIRLGRYLLLNTRRRAVVSFTGGKTSKSSRKSRPVGDILWSCNVVCATVTPPLRYLLPGRLGGAGPRRTRRSNPARSPQTTRRAFANVWNRFADFTETPYTGAIRRFSITRIFARSNAVWVRLVSVAPNHTSKA